MLPRDQNGPDEGTGLVARKGRDSAERLAVASQQIDPVQGLPESRPAWATRECGTRHDQWSQTRSFSYLPRSCTWYATCREKCFLLDTCLLLPATEGASSCEAACDGSNCGTDISGSVWEPSTPRERTSLLERRGGTIRFSSASEGEIAGRHASRRAQGSADFEQRDASAHLPASSSG